MDLIRQAVVTKALLLRRLPGAYLGPPMPPIIAGAGSGASSSTAFLDQSRGPPATRPPHNRSRPPRSARGRCRGNGLRHAQCDRLNKRSCAFAGGAYASESSWSTWPGGQAHRQWGGHPLPEPHRRRAPVSLHATPTPAWTSSCNSCGMRMSPSPAVSPRMPHPSSPSRPPPSGLLPGPTSPSSRCVTPSAGVACSDPQPENRADWWRAGVARTSSTRGSGSPGDGPVPPAPSGPSRPNPGNCFGPFGMTRRPTPILVVGNTTTRRPPIHGARTGSPACLRVPSPDV